MGDRTRGEKSVVEKLQGERSMGDGAWGERSGGGGGGPWGREMWEIELGERKKCVVEKL